MFTQFGLYIVDQCMRHNSCTFQNHFVGVVITAVSGLCKDRNRFFGYCCSVFICNNFTHQTFRGFCYCIQNCLAYTITNSSMQSLSVYLNVFQHFAQTFEAVCFFSYQFRFDVLINDRNKVFCQEQWISSACTGVLYSCTVSPCNLSVFQNQHNRDGFSCLSYRFESRCYSFSEISSTICYCTFFDGSLVIKEKSCSCF